MSKDDLPGLFRAGLCVGLERSDGIVAPIFYLAIGGVPAALAYKAINTLDSMIGHRGKHYEYFGKCAARLDDVASFIPARVTALLFVCAAWTLLRKSQACESCGKTFACEISFGKGCWCGEIKLSDEAREELRAKYSKCLCRACLEKAAATNSASEAKANA